MNLPAKILTASLLALSATACVYVDGERVNFDQEEWQDRQDKNRARINDLELGMSRDTVAGRLGTPDFTEAFTKDGKDMRVLFYRTQHRHSDGETTKDETTPLVFSDGKLIGWGHDTYDTLR